MESRYLLSRLTGTNKDKELKPCWRCKGTDWWWRPAGKYGPGEWLCSQCHPDPAAEAALAELVERSRENEYWN